MCGLRVVPVFVTGTFFSGFSAFNPFIHMYISIFQFDPESDVHRFVSCKTVATLTRQHQFICFIYTMCMKGFALKTCFVTGALRYL